MSRYAQIFLKLQQKALQTQVCLKVLESNLSKAFLASQIIGLLISVGATNFKVIDIKDV